MSEEIHSTDIENENLVFHKPLHNYRFTQQRLPGWRPVLTTFNAVIILFCGCAVLLALGLAFLFLQNGYNQVRVRYDDKCPDLNSVCNVELNVEKDIKGNLELRYQLTKFYQNHRRYGFSRIDSQLAGSYVDFSGMANCKPYRSHEDKEDPNEWILPCGLFAVSVFNDSFELTNGPTFVEKGIAYKSEIDYLFKNLNEKYKTGDKWLDNLANIFPGGVTNEHFIVWMRQAALPNVIKPYAKCDNCEIKAGKYQVKITNRYPTTQFKGEKYFMISKVTTLGTNNIYLGIVFIISACICGVYAIILLVAQMIAPRKMGEFSNNVM